jgi:hypothetical protein
MAAIGNTFYKLRHIPTGKFYKPASGYTWQKNNLSPTGKTYNKKAINFSTVSRLHVPVDFLPEKPDVSRSGHYKTKVVETLPTEWEWVEFTVIEKQTSPISNPKA